MWSVNVLKAREHPADPNIGAELRRELAIKSNLNTCHIWSEDGEHVAEMRDGRPSTPPLQIGERLVQLGRDPDEWARGIS